ncbi:hypothetical protein [Micromonospora sp. NPDC049282]|uniref:hypothetical protein n=1 Tax=Micromonospora sp. NPDC049282 TaxID=3364269 RepID=UPI00371C48FA
MNTLPYATGETVRVRDGVAVGGGSEPAGRHAGRCAGGSDRRRARLTGEPPAR